MRSRARAALGLAAAVGAATALAAALGWGAARLAHASPGEGSADVEFARDMSAHHAQAVEMALAIRDRTADPDLGTLALDVVLTQQAQVGMMSGWLASWGVPASGPTAPMQGHGESMGMASRAEVNALGTLPASEAEVAFLKLMIRHHRGGVTMAEAALPRLRRPEVRALARAIAVAQRSEIDALTALLEERGAAPDPAGEPAPPHDGHAR